MVALGELVAAGRTSDVYAFGAGAVVKVPRPDVPDHWAPMEADFTAAVRALNVPAPNVLDLIQVGGRHAIVFERIEGRSMWELMVDQPDRIPALAVELAGVHRVIQSAGPPRGLDGLVQRMSRKLGEAVQISEAERSEARSLAESLPRGAALLHGDLHPGNVLMTQGGPVAIDWFDASIGHPVADVVRSSILMRPFGERQGPPHLPGADVVMATQLHDAYVGAMLDVLDVPDEVLRTWEALAAASRLSERAQPDDPALISLWDQRNECGPTALLDAVSRSGS